MWADVMLVFSPESQLRLPFSLPAPPLGFCEAPGGSGWLKVQQWAYASPAFLKSSRANVSQVDAGRDRTVNLCLLQQRRHQLRTC